MRPPRYIEPAYLNMVNCHYSPLQWSCCCFVLKGTLSGHQYRRDCADHAASGERGGRVGGHAWRRGVGNVSRFLCVCVLLTEFSSFLNHELPPLSTVDI